MLHEIMQSPDRDIAEEEIKRFVAEFEARSPKATSCLLKDREALLTFHDFPAEGWIHLRTTNLIQSGFATVKTHTRQNKGGGSRNARLALPFNLILAAQSRWRRVNAPELVRLIRAGTPFKNGEPTVPMATEDDASVEPERIDV